MLFKQSMFFGIRQIGCHHFLHHLVERYFGHPAEFFFGFGGVAKQGFDFSGAKVTGINFDDWALAFTSALSRNDRGIGPVPNFIYALTVPSKLHVQCRGSFFNKLAHAVLHTSGNNKIFRLHLLQHHPLHAHVVFGVAPVAQSVNIAHEEAVFQALVDIGQTSSDFSGDKGFAPAWTFVVKQYAVAGIHAVGLAVIYGDPVGVKLGYGIGAARIEGSGFFLRRLLHQAIKLAGTGLVKAGFFLEPQNANGFENAQRSHAVDVCGVFRAFKADGYMALSTKVVDFVGLRLLDDARQTAAVAQVAVVQLEACVVHMRVLVDMVYALSVKAGRAALDSVNGIAFIQQEFSEVGAVLAGNAGDQGGFGLRVDVAHAVFLRKS